MRRPDPLTMRLDAGIIAIDTIEVASRRVTIPPLASCGGVIIAALTGILGALTGLLSVILRGSAQP